VSNNIVKLIYFNYLIYFDLQTRIRMSFKQCIQLLYDLEHTLQLSIYRNENVNKGFANANSVPKKKRLLDTAVCWTSVNKDRE
jgi:hypothetical protein